MTSKYDRTMTNTHGSTMTVDVYDVLRAFDIRDPALQAALLQAMQDVVKADGVETASEVDLLGQPAPYRVAGYHAAQDGRRRRHPPPVALGQLVDVFQEHRAMGQQPGPDNRGIVLSPFQAGVTHIKR